jgi:hypothetical protein
VEILTSIRVLLDQIPERTIRQVVESVFGADDYGKTTWLMHLGDWLGRMFARFFSWIAPAFGVLRRSPPLFWAVLIALALLTAAAVARWLYLWRARNALRASGAGWDHLSGASRADAWGAAQMLAARGDYTAAAHALYAALLDAGARQEQIKIHPSKTTGDYVREVRRTSSPIFPRLRDFARAYEIVIYGLGVCDRERYERLVSIALPIVAPRG